MIVYIINPIVINHAAMAILVLTDKFLNFNKLFFILFVLVLHWVRHYQSYCLINNQL